MQNLKIDKFQKRYLEHQSRKKNQLAGNLSKQLIKNPNEFKKLYLNIIKKRRSQRLFNSKKITKRELDFILNCIVESPSSCNRQAISIKIISDLKQKEKIGTLLVGGTNWCHKANIIFLFFANDEAYKENLFYMPFLDTGFLAMNAYLACESINIGCCYINPNIREENKEIFRKKFGKKTFCGALAIGHYNNKSNYSPKIKKEEILL